MNGNHLWEEATKKELTQMDDFNVFRFLNQGESIDDYQKLPYHMVFDVKFDLRRKARLVVGGDHQTSHQKPYDKEASGSHPMTLLD